MKCRLVEHEGWLREERIRAFPRKPAVDRLLPFLRSSAPPIRRSNHHDAGIHPADIRHPRQRHRQIQL
jgi:hypothetical protein